MKIKLVFLSSILGIIDVAYIWLETSLNNSLYCSVLDGCDKVLNSVYSNFLGISLFFWGAIYYLTIFFVVLFVLLNIWDIRKMKIVFLTSLAGFLFSLYLVYLQIFILKAFCFYCLLSALFTTVIFFASLSFIKEVYGKR